MYKKIIHEKKTCIKKDFYRVSHYFFVIYVVSYVDIFNIFFFFSNFYNWQIFTTVVRHIYNKVASRKPQEINQS